MRPVLSCLVLAALAQAAPRPTSAQDKPKGVNEANVTTATATVEAIDSSKRLVTLKGEQGRVITLRVPEEVERFSAIKVGDKVTARYIESIALQVRRPGEAAAATKPAVDAALVQRPGEKPGGTLSVQLDAKVKVLQIDSKTPALTVQKPDGTTASFRVEDPKRITGLKVGDEIEITYTEAVLLTVDPPGKK